MCALEGEFSRGPDQSRPGKAGGVVGKSRFKFKTGERIIRVIDIFLWLARNDCTLDVSSVGEASSGEIDLSDDKQLVVAQALKYIYTTDYDEINPKDVSECLVRHSNTEIDPYDTSDGPEDPPDRPTENSDGSSLIVHAHMYTFADKYDITDLQDLAASKLKDCLDTSCNTNGFCKAVEVLYGGIICKDDVLRKLVVKRACDNIHVMLKRDDFIELLGNLAEFSIDVVRRMAEMLKQQEADVEIRNLLRLEGRAGGRRRGLGRSDMF
ncbi:hypothetical protein GP486_004818 [Trichoglossum hirsutum]|uniref:BTB domain-containing protein n=1 Tax=Trichoglossum hirsutum TaxID=265104 RepID=A0A9P8LAC3_9PEZI|nr:hypothetical protein GP486_004818 [Trichoglossum hirsutum]